MASLREALRRELFDVLDKCGVGAKALVWDETLIGRFGLIVDQFKILQERQVDKMFMLEDLVKDGDRLKDSVKTIKNIIFVVRPKLDLMEKINAIVKAQERSGTGDKEFHLVYVPRVSSLCQKKLEDLGVYGSISFVDEYSMDLLPLDSDVMSMEAEAAFKECVLLKDETIVFQIAKGLMKLQSLFGIIPQVTEFNGREGLSEHVANILFRMRREMAGQEPQISSEIDHLILIDRDVDPITVLLTPLTYEGLIDETFGIESNRVKLPPEKFAKKNEDGIGEMPLEPQTLQLNSAEELYAELRDKNFQAVGPVLSRKAKDLTLDFRDKDNAKSVADLKKLVAKLPHMQAAKKSLANHTSIAELIKEVIDEEEFGQTLATQQTFYCLDTEKENSYILDCIAKQDPILKIFRLVCLQSLCNDGLRKTVYESYKKEILQVYGFEHLLSLSYLERCGLFAGEQSRLATGKTYQTLSKNLQLVDEIPENADSSAVSDRDLNPKDVSFVFSMYAPMSVKLVQMTAKGGPNWRKNDNLRFLPGPVNERSQKPGNSSSSSSPPGSIGGRKKKTLVFFIGGVTYAEIAALRFLSQQDDAVADYVIATTKVVNGDSWISSLIGDVKRESLVGF